MAWALARLLARQEKLCPWAQAARAFSTPAVFVDENTKARRLLALQLLDAHAQHRSSARASQARRARSTRSRRASWRACQASCSPLEQALQYGTKLVGGVTPGKGGSTHLGAFSGRGCKNTLLTPAGPQACPFLTPSLKQRRRRVLTRPLSTCRHLLLVCTL